MSFEALSERLSALQETNAQLRQYVERLANLKFQPGSIPLNNDEGNVVDELASEIQQTIREQDEDFELLQEEVYDIAAGRPGSEVASRKAALDGTVKRAIQELQACQTDFRKAQLKAKRNIEAARKEERILLAQSYAKPRTSNSSSPIPGQPSQPQRRRQQERALNKDEKTVNAATDVTMALRRTHEMMASELSRSQFAHETLVESTAALAQLGETYSTLDTMLSTSKNLIGTLLRSQKSDTWYLETAFYVLLVTIAWLIYRRFLYGPLWWFVWFPVRIFYRSLIGVLSGIGIIGGTAVSSVGPSAGGASILQNSATVEMPKASVVQEIPPAVEVGNSDNTEPHGDTMVEEVGRIIEESQEADQAKGETVEPVETEANPKKRMWEEDKEQTKKNQIVRDEL
ncbi:hypothetical protein PVAG01_05311 [Phlyctema vagabunda]|uniref:Sec20 C-terminal domain-containing protein n=1 Tax=Phlyctema vagabunda TaxID=108571 RepID=A0ABR4PJQ7_9HELO